MSQVTLTNSTDFTMAEHGLLPRETVRSERIEALVDPGATTLALPADLVARLGFSVIDTRPVRTSTGATSHVPVVGGILLEVFGRKMTCDALVLPAGHTPRIGQHQLLELDLVIDAISGELRVASPVHIVDLLAVSG